MRYGGQITRSFQKLQSRLWGLDGPEDGPAPLSDIKRQGMDAAGQIRPQSRVNGAVAGDAGHRAKGRSPDRYGKMRLATFAPAAMTAVFFAIILNFQRIWGKGRNQPITNFICDGHFVASPLQSGAQCRKLSPPSRKGKPDETTL